MVDKCIIFKYVFLNQYFQFKKSIWKCSFKYSMNDYKFIFKFIDTSGPWDGRIMSYGL